MTTLLAWIMVMGGIALVTGGLALAYPPLSLVALGLVVCLAGALLIDIGE